MEKRYRWADIADVLREKYDFKGEPLGDFARELDGRTKATDAERMTTMEGQLKELGERMDKARDELAEHIMEKMGNWLNRTVMAEHLEEHATEQKRVDRMESKATMTLNDVEDKEAYDDEDDEDDEDEEPSTTIEPGGHITINLNIKR